MSAQIAKGELAGMMLGIALTQISAQELPEACWTARRQASDRLFRGIMPWFFAATAISLVGAVFAAEGKRRMLFGAATVSFLGAVGGTAGLNVPINQRVASWTPGSAPETWTHDRDWWLQAHLLRTALGTCAFGCTALANRVPKRS